MGSTLKTREQTEAIAKLIEGELARLGWLCTDAAPTLYTTAVESDLPAGWVRVYDDYTSHYGDAEETLAILKALPEGSEYGEGLQDGGKPESSSEWPSDLFSVEQLEEGTVNDNPNCVITVQTNGGTRYAAGPHGVSCCALSDWLDNVGELAATREEAIETGCEMDERGGERERS